MTEDECAFARGLLHGGDVTRDREGGDCVDGKGKVVAYASGVVVAESGEVGAGSLAHE